MSSHLIEMPPNTAGIKEGLYDTEALAAYLLYRLNVLNPICACSRILLFANIHVELKTSHMIILTFQSCPD